MTGVELECNILASYPMFVVLTTRSNQSSPIKLTRGRDVLSHLGFLEIELPRISGNRVWIEFSIKRISI